jgi:signal transduction histidine kinase
MPEAVAIARGVMPARSRDALLAVILGAGTVSYLATQAGLASHAWAVTLSAVALCSALGLRLSHPILGAAVIAASCLLIRATGQLAAANNGKIGDATTVLSFGIVFVLSYTMGSHLDITPGLVGVVLLAFAANVTDTTFNPFVEVLAFGPWLAGRVVGSRRRINQQLQARSRELEAERELFARESVRIERTRIARELHDIVAHCVSVMVIQASAGQRLIAADPASASEALDSIAEAAKQAEQEVGRLVELLGTELTTGQQPGLHLVDELVKRANSTGILINCRFEGDCSRLTPTGSDAAYRVIQEGITNALKHAPGAPVHITVRETAEHIKIEILNPPAHAQRSGLEQAGGNNGLNGMRERVSACGGQLTGGATTDGGWILVVLMPTS